MLTNNCLASFHPLAMTLLQAVLNNRPQVEGVHDPDKPKTLEFKEGSKAVFLGAGHAGCLATVIPDPALRGINKRAPSTPVRTYCVRVQPSTEDANAAAMVKNVVRQAVIQYIPSGSAAKVLGINPRTLGRITGNVWVGDGDARADIGLAVKNAKQGLCVPGKLSTCCHMTYADNGGAAVCVLFILALHPALHVLKTDYSTHTGSTFHRIACLGATLHVFKMGYFHTQCMLIEGSCLGCCSLCGVWTHNVCSTRSCLHILLI